MINAPIDNTLTDEEIMLLEFGTKKKKKPKTIKLTVAVIEPIDTIILDNTPPIEYTYEFMLDRIMELKDAKLNVRRNNIPPPTIIKNGTKRIVWTNFQDFVETVKRETGHIFHYISTELGSECSIDGMGRLVIKGKFAPKYIESLMCKYVTEYVECSSCHCYNTTITKDIVSRLYFIRCINCMCVRSVSTIKQGFHAQTRADRIALRK